MKRVWIGAALAAASLWSLAVTAQIKEVAVTGGQIQGVPNHGVSSFKGIPFAAPPVGELRWKAPQPVKRWSGVKQANEFAHSCMQDPGMLTMFGASPNPSEDCLYLNVWTPAKTASDKLPVMVWIYGGGFAAGTTSIAAYDGTRLALKGVVLVSVNYRVGAMGFLALPELTKEGKGSAGNYGLLDQIAGLEWVRQNIARFGGDPSRVTIFGESAGGISVSMLAAAPRAKGLFQRVISESGGSFAPLKYANEGGQNVPPLQVAETQGQAFLKKLGVADLKAARALSAETLQNAQGRGMTGGFWPVADGIVLQGDQYGQYESGSYNETPVLIGTNSDEGGMFVPGTIPPSAFEAQIRDGFGAKADTVLAAYPHASDAEATTATQNVFRDSTFAWHTWAWAKLQARRSSHKVFVYYFDHRTPQSPNGAGHGSEIGFVFGNLGGPGGGPAGLAGAPRPEDLYMTRLMSSYWVNFAKTGDPNGEGLKPWPAFTSREQQVMVFDAKPSPRPVPNLQQLQALDEYYAWRRAQIPKLSH